MDHTNLRIAAAVLAIIAGGGAAIAQADENERRGMPTFETLDVDGDGEITAADIEALRASRFAEIDTDGNGEVSEAEFIARAQEQAGDRATRMFERLDADGDGVLSRDVLESRGGRGMGERLLSRADTNDSGGVSAEEFEAIKDRMAERRGGRGGKGDNRRR